ncbi:unnamed protein product [Mesocestoides corti]|uniref:Amyloid protein-binding protein 2 n=1 Tax=Mesocestoides corti TaxID=53468 RepID=A0A0R3UKY8_MESCO|nr:unnamed protein product [Mesocestoides corti]
MPSQPPIWRSPPTDVTSWGRRVHVIFHATWLHAVARYRARVCVKAVVELKQLFLSVSLPAQQLMDLRMEAAYNLQLLYRHNKNPEMARYIMQKYLVIE